MSSPVSPENVATDNLESSHLGEAPKQITAHKMVNDSPPAIDTEQNSALAALATNINTAFESVQNHIDGLSPLRESEADKASLSEGLKSIRQLALKLCQTIPGSSDPQQDSGSFHGSTAELSPGPFTAFNDADADDSRSEDSYTLVDPSHAMKSHFYTQESDNKENESFDVTVLPDWACTVTAGGCRVPLFWEGGDMGYFVYHQEQIKAVKGIR